MSIQNYICGEDILCNAFSFPLAFGVFLIIIFYLGYFIGRRKTGESRNG
ncbi:hypothetical protein LCGC14_1402560 [marine sediment metagenome]|uniref:Uncharacterized protein n=1 Tax=marine sediment metagenome TaxID=412755 RepID=A0A0F9JWL1_9ZZZZ